MFIFLNRVILLLCLFENSGDMQGCVCPPVSVQYTAVLVLRTTLLDEKFGSSVEFDM